jgi:hypothetical protein
MTRGQSPNGDTTLLKLTMPHLRLVKGHPEIDESSGRRITTALVVATVPHAT